MPSAEGLAARFTRLPLPRAARCPAARSPASANMKILSGDFLIDRYPDFSNVWLMGVAPAMASSTAPLPVSMWPGGNLNADAMEPRYSLATKAETHHRRVF